MAVAASEKAPVVKELSLEEAASVRKPNESKNRDQAFLKRGFEDNDKLPPTHDSGRINRIPIFVDKRAFPRPKPSVEDDSAPVPPIVHTKQRLSQLITRKNEDELLKSFQSPFGSSQRDATADGVAARKPPRKLTDQEYIELMIAKTSELELATPVSPTPAKSVTSPLSVPSSVQKPKPSLVGKQPVDETSTPVETKKSNDMTDERMYEMPSEEELSWEDRTLSKRYASLSRCDRVFLILADLGMVEVTGGLG